MINSIDRGKSHPLPQEFANLKEPIVSFIKRHTEDKALDDRSMREDEMQIDGYRIKVREVVVAEGKSTFDIHIRKQLEALHIWFDHEGGISLSYFSDESDRKAPSLWWDSRNNLGNNKFADDCIQKKIAQLVVPLCSQEKMDDETVEMQRRNLQEATATLLRQKTNDKSWQKAWEHFLAV